MFFAMSEFGPVFDGRRFSPPLSCERGRKQQEEAIWGVSDPLCHPRILVPRLDSWGSLTPEVCVAVVRRNRAQSVTSSGASLVPRAINRVVSVSHEHA